MENHEFYQMQMSERLRNVLLREGISSLEELNGKPEIELMSLRGFGITCLRELKKILNERQMTLTEKPANPKNPRAIERIYRAIEDGAKTRREIAKDITSALDVIYPEKKHRKPYLTQQ